jgi:hypothetical protein
MCKAEIVGVTYDAFHECRQTPGRDGELGF